MNKTLILPFFFVSILSAQQMQSYEGTVFGTLNSNTEARIIKAVSYTHLTLPTKRIV